MRTRHPALRRLPHLNTVRFYPFRFNTVRFNTVRLSFQKVFQSNRCLSTPVVDWAILPERYLEVRTNRFRLSSILLNPQPLITGTLVPNHQGLRSRLPSTKQSVSLSSSSLFLSPEHQSLRRLLATMKVCFIDLCEILGVTAFLALCNRIPLAEQSVYPRTTAPATHQSTDDLRCLG